MTPWRRLSHWLVRSGGGGLATRIVVLSLLLLLMVQVAGFAVVRSFIDHNARVQLANELKVGERVWRRAIETQAQRVHQGALMLSADFGFRAAVATDDAATISSALDNHGGRIGASVAALLGTDFRPRAVHTAEADDKALSTLLHDIGQALSREGGGSRVALIGGRPHLWVVAQLRAPVTIGWVLMAVPVGQNMVDDIYSLSTMHVTLLTRASAGVERIAATTLGAGAQALLGQPLAAEGVVTLDHEELYARVLNDSVAGGQVRTVLMRSVAEVAAPFRQLQWLLAVITLVGLALFAVGSALTARRVTGPLRSLVEASERLGRGEYNTLMRGVERHDEIGELARAFDQMRLNIGAKEAEMRRLAYTDRLTGLPNRAAFGAELLIAVQRADMRQRELSVLMLDLDRFKHVNDVLGYAIGDQLLCAVAQRLATVVVRDDDLVACLGGDKFALLLLDASADTARAVAQRIAVSFEQPLTLGEHTVDLSAGIGIACWPTHAGGGADLLVHAEVAMYSAKRRHEAVCVYDPAQDSSSGQSLSLLSELRRAVDGAELRLFLQPKIALGSGRLVGVEALVRWQHPQRGLVPPMEFIPFAEQTGFIRQLTLWVMDDAARQWKSLQSHGPVRVSVNLSTRDLMDLDLPRKLDAILRRHGVPESGFCLEITESAIMDDPLRAEATLNALSNRGFKLSIDDFGTGYSSLAYLRRLPVDELKIDRSFVLAMENGLDDAAIVRSTIDLAHNLGLSVVAEGIENARVYRQLAGLNCDEGQGYHMSRPLPLADFLLWAERWHAAQAPTSSPVSEPVVEPVVEPVFEPAGAATLV